MSIHQGKEAFAGEALDLCGQKLIRREVEKDAEFAYSCHIAGELTAFDIRMPPPPICLHRNS
jgi:hypothetical protein